MCARRVGCCAARAGGCRAALAGRVAGWEEVMDAAGDCRASLGWCKCIVRDTSLIFLNTEIFMIVADRVPYEAVA